MDNTEKSVIHRKELNTIPSFRSVRSTESIGNAGKKIRFGLSIIASILSLVSLVLLVNMLESNISIGFKPTVTTQEMGLSKNYYTTAYNNVFTGFDDMYDITVTILDGTSYDLKVPMVTVGEIVSNYFSAEYLTDNYEFNLNAGTIVKNGMDISVRKLDWIEYEIVNMEIEFETIYVDVQTIPKGQEVTVQTGENAVVTRTMRDKYFDGEYDSSVIKEEIVHVKGVDEIVYRGIGGEFTTTRGVTYEYSYYIDVTATAYGVDTGYGGDSEYTYTGKIAEIGVIAVDPEVIPLGSKLYVISDYMDHGICYAEDIGSAIKGNHIDVHLGDNLDVQLAFGVRNGRVYVLE